MPPESHFVQHSNLSHAWGQALRLVSQPGGEMVPLAVSVTDIHKTESLEDLVIRADLDNLLLRLGKQSTESVANTIFPMNMWNPAKPREELFRRYLELLPRILSASPKNRNGTYFGRLIGARSSDVHDGNQLDFIINTYKARSGVRRSVLQAATFDPVLDHTTAALRGFPCLQHLSFSPHGQNLLAVNAFYAVQYIGERAYGNYLGLINLGKFLAHELGLTLDRATCYTGIAKRDLPLKDLRPLLRTLRHRTDA